MSDASQDQTPAPPDQEVPTKKTGWTRRSIIKAAAVTAAAAGAATAGILAFPMVNTIGRVSKKNIILIVCDSLRADRLGRKKHFLGSLKSLTPNIDGIASDGASFADAKSPSSATLMSMLSLAYNIPATQYDYMRASGTRPTTPSLAATLAAQGYLTLFSSANMVLEAEQYTRGFAESAILEVSERSQQRRKDGFGGALCPETSGGRLNGRTLSLVRKHARQLEKQPLFLQVHYMDTHWPYNHTGYPMDVAIDDRLCADNLNPLILKGKTHFGKNGWTIEQALSNLTEYYDCSAYAVDTFIGALLAELGTNKLLGDCLLIITADHGEEFADATEITMKNVGHGGLLNEEEIHVPLVVRSAGGAACLGGGRRITGQVSSATAIHAMVNDYVSVQPGAYSEVRSAMEAGVFPDHEMISAIGSYRTGANEAAHIWKDEAGFVKHRIFYDDTGAVTGEKAFRYLKEGGLAGVEVSQQIKDRTAKVLGAYKPRSQPFDKDTQRRLRALGYLN